MNTASPEKIYVAGHGGMVGGVIVRAYWPSPKGDWASTVRKFFGNAEQGHSLLVTWCGKSVKKQ